jgi:serine/threonine protein kinase
VSTSESRSGLVLELAEEFLDRSRRGERPSLKEYIARHPTLADEIREVFPAMAMMERVALADWSLAGRPGEPASSPGPPPTQLGDYRIIREVGRGGMGVVFEAEQISLGRSVALKVLPPLIFQDPRRRDRFEREARSAAKLHHTNIVPVFGLGECGGTPYYVMQFIRGLGLDEVLDELKRMRTGQRPTAAATGGGPEDSRPNFTAADVAYSLMTGRPDAATPSDAPPGAAGGMAEPSGDGRLAGSLSGSSSSLSLLGDGRGPDGRGSRAKRPNYWQSVARIGVQVAEALEYAHNQGILHRDIKPSNLLLDTRGTVWVADFGLAKASGQPDLTHTGDLLGTLRYMPPEAFAGKSDTRGDVYSLGLTLYELLAFRPAFDETDRGRLVHRVTTEAPERLGRLNPAVPRDLETIVQKAIEREPVHRYATAGELAADLQRFLDDEPIRARRTTAVERSARWTRRNPAITALGGVLVVLLVAVTVASLLVASHMARLAERQTRAAEGEREARLVALRQTRAAEAQKARADANFAKARAAVDDYLTKVGDSQLLGVPGMQPLRRQLLESALEFYEGFLKERGDDPAVRTGLADAQLRVARIHQVMGQEDEARRAFSSALALYQSLARREDLLAADPGNTRLRQELASTRMALARIGVALGQAERARADLGAAAAIAPDDPQVARQAMRLYATLGLHAEAIAELDRAVRGVGVDRHWTSPRSGLLLDLAAHEETYARLLELRPEDDHLRAIRGRHLATRGDWERAGEEYRRAIGSSPIESEEPVEYAAILLLEGDTARYRALVQDLIGTVDASTDHVALQVIARICGLSPSPGVGPDQVVGWAERAFEADSRAWYVHALGLALYRAGRYDEAIALLERWNGSGWQPIGYLQNDSVLAMAHERKGHTARARDLFSRVDAWCRQARADPDLNDLRTKTVDWLHLQVLHREARAVIGDVPIFPAEPFAR